MQTLPFNASLDVGTGDPVLCLHSSTSTKAQWRPLAAALASSHRVMAVDLHGYGANPLPPDIAAFGLQDEVRLVASRAIEMMGGARPMHVVGHSYGGAVALELARTRPELARSLALYEPVCMSLLDRDGPYYYVMRMIADHVAACVRGHDFSEAARVFVDYWGGPGTYDSHEASAGEKLDRAVAKVPFDFAALAAGPEAPSAYPAIRVPTLLMAGTASRESVRMIAKSLWSAMPRAQLVELAGDHLLPIRDPATVNREIGRFLDSLGARNASLPLTRAA